jgi:hypothetical protein
MILLLSGLIGIGGESFAQQPLTYSKKREFRNREDSLKVFANDIVNGESASSRFRSDSQFIRSLVRALKLPNSFYYPFDSLETIKKTIFFFCRRGRSR